MKLKKGDKVKILKGKDRLKTGTILRAIPETLQVIVDGLNLYKKRTKPRGQGKPGEMVLVPRPLAASRVALVCGNCKQATRIGSRIEGEKKMRYCKKCQANL